MALGSIVFLAMALLAHAGCASRGEPRKTRFEREFERYLSLPHQKAMVIAGSPDGRWVYGYGYSFLSKGMAQDTAMEQCNVRKRSLGPGAECVIYAIGNEIVWESPSETTSD
jgi:hypothetical protein